MRAAQLHRGKDTGKERTRSERGAVAHEATHRLRFKEENN